MIKQPNQGTGPPRGSGLGVEEEIAHGKYTTPDDPAKVAAWYRKKLAFQPREGLGRGEEEIAHQPASTG